MVISLRNTRGDASEYVLLIIIIFFLAVSFTVVLFANSKVLEVIQDTELNSTTAAPDIINAFELVNSTVVQRGFLLMFGILALTTLVSSFLIKSHPIFLFIYIFALMATVLLGVYLGNIFEDIIAVEDFATIMAEQPMITSIMSNIVKIMIGIAVLSLIILFSKLQSAPIGGGQDL